MSNNDEERMLKNVEHYSVMLNAFIDGRNEFDKQILTISVAALGFIISFADKISKNSCWSQMALILSALSFLTTILIILRILSLNTKYIENEIRENNEQVALLSKEMIIFDFLAKTTFAIGLILSTILFIVNL